MHAVILAGGTGTRLWPLTRTYRPKQLQSLVSKKTLLEETLKRLSFLSKKNLYVSTTEALAKEVRKIAKSRVPKGHVIVEPTLRDTAAAIGLAAVRVSQNDPNAVLAVIYADHYIRDTRAFQKSLLLAAEVARRHNAICAMTVKAQYPNTNLGYVKIGNIVSRMRGHEVFALEKFIEKPSLPHARKFAASYRYLWNTGLYVFPVKLLLDLYRRYVPTAYQLLMEIKTHPRALAQAYPRIPKISIDYAIMEKIDPKHVRVLVMDFGWSDIGNFAALFTKLSSDRRGNLVRGPFMGRNNTGCLIYNYDTKLVTALGLSDMVVVNTPDAMLLCPRERSSDVKALVATLKRHGKIALL